MSTEHSKEEELVRQRVEDKDIVALTEEFISECKKFMRTMDNIKNRIPKGRKPYVYYATGALHRNVEAQAYLVSEASE